jgi:hypothetical protein
LDLIAQVEAMNKVINFLKLDPSVRHEQVKQEAQADVDQAKQNVQAVAESIAEINARRQRVLTGIHTAFGRLQESLNERQQLLKDEIVETAQSLIEAGQGLKATANENLAAAKGKESEVIAKDPEEVTQADISLKLRIKNEPLPYFPLGFRCNTGPDLSLIMKLGRVGRWMVEVPYECKHYRGITYLSIPFCCEIPYCCEECHDQTESHTWMSTLRTICMHCEKEQAYRRLPNTCQKCGIYHSVTVIK